ncbi:polyphosphate kinase 1 [Jeotgalibaca dankookensis]|uniref:polyphosphate kinase 1 n=1 Tax=Jeotgalibaca dankookensis TaxID=708126 RepID=UPI000785E1C4|nr:polyphosphate kinase 1 [Jeotgalibaca dankookensis]
MTIPINQYDLHAPEYFFNRELSWLAFNQRVILEAKDETNPLLEKARFLAIGSSNLDEFFMVRVARLQDQLKLAPAHRDLKSQLTAHQQLQAISEMNRQNTHLQYELFSQLKKEFSDQHIFFSSFDQLDSLEKDEVTNHFRKKILPLLDPIRIDNRGEFPKLQNKRLYLFARLRKSQVDSLTVIPLSESLERFYILRSENKIKVILIEDLVESLLGELFSNFELVSTFPFRITRNANFEIDEDDGDDFLVVMEEAIRQRQDGETVRLEIKVDLLNKAHQIDFAFLKNQLEVNQRECYIFHDTLDLTFLFELITELQDGFPTFLYSPFSPIIPRELRDHSLFAEIKKGDVFLHHPYDSFQPVIDFIDEAANDPQTYAIKQTLYRLSEASPIIASLKQAAENGIAVTVLVELKARFDEKNNIHWAKELEDSGASVLYGVTGLKTHSKISLVIKNEGHHRVCYAHIGTGNYNDHTARGYEDMGIFTSHPELVEDAHTFFNYLIEQANRPTYRQLSVSPYDIRSSLIHYIDREIALHQQYGNGRMIAKMNSLTDKTLIIKLYEASQAGVQVDLIIRGICCLRPGIPGVSDNIRVTSVIGRYLEHSRIYYFHHNGKDNLFLSSADMMTRNMINRVEIAFPILDATIKQEIQTILSVYLADNQKAWSLTQNGDYLPITNQEKPLSAQNYFIKKALDEEKKK